MENKDFRTPYAKYLKKELRDAIDSCDDGKCISEEFCQGVSNLINHSWKRNKAFDKISADGKHLINQACQYESWRIASFLQNDYETGCEHDFIPWHTKNVCTNEVCELPYDGNNTISVCPNVVEELPEADITLASNKISKILSDFKRQIVEKGICYSMIVERIYKLTRIEADELAKIQNFISKIESDDDYRRYAATELKVAMRDDFDECRDSNCIGDRFCEHIANPPDTDFSNDGRAAITARCQNENWRLQHIILHDFEKACRFEIVAPDSEIPCLFDSEFTDQVFDNSSKIEKIFDQF